MTTQIKIAEIASDAIFGDNANRYKANLELHIPACSGESSLQVEESLSGDNTISMDEFNGHVGVARVKLGTPCTIDVEHLQILATTVVGKVLEYQKLSDRDEKAEILTDIEQTMELAIPAICDGQYSVWAASEWLCDYLRELKIDELRNLDADKLIKEARGEGVLFCPVSQSPADYIKECIEEKCEAVE
ncbi:MAG: hypothetical protein OXC63_08165 [Aestuariivita sp.]|nr:hypothetical protein [Aestuariivita sp.]MCY4345365.1 hypothetical protein [Aestuariivita sp.]